MKFIKITLTILLVVFTFNLMAQQFLNQDKKILSVRKQAHQTICLLKNENNLVPIKNLNQNIACLSIGCDTIITFQKRISDYSLVAHFNIRKTESASTLQQLKNKLKKFNLVIVSFHNLHDSPRKAYGITAQMDELYKFAADSLPSIIVIFGTTNSLNIFNGATEAKTLLISSADSIENQDFAAQIIFGGMPAIGKLKIDVNDHFKSGDGLETNEIIRFSYQLPEELGLNSEYINSKIDSIAERSIKEGAFPGCQILAAKNGTIFFHKTYGFHTFDSIIAVKKSDLYDFASITKITGPLPALMRLYDQGKFKLDTPFYAYWPDFKHSNKKHIFVRDVLSHQAKLQPYIAFWKNTYKKNGKFRYHTFKSDSSKNYNIKVTNHLFLHKNYRKKVYKAVKKSELLTKKEYVYSGLSFLLYPEIIKNLTGSDYESYLKQNFYRPLGAYTLTYNPLKIFAKSRLVPTENDTFFRNQQICGIVHDEAATVLGGVSGNAGLFGTTLDLAKLMQMYLNMGQYGGIQFISDTTLREFTRYQYPENDNKRGLGFDKPMLKDKENGYTAIDASDSSFGHSGFTGTFTWVDPKNGILFVFMSNRVYPTRNNTKIYELNIRPSIQQVLYDAGKKRN